MISKLLIWDIDGTLIKTEGLGKKALEEAFEIMTGIKDACSCIKLSGKTDLQIFYEMCEVFNADASKNKEFIETYCNVLEARVKDTPIEINPNVSYLLEALERKDVANVLGTGNIERGGRIKLEPVGLNKFFRTGGFSDGEVERWRIIDRAIANAEKLYNTSFDKNDIFVIGDTPRDVECAKVLDVKSIAVATGNYLANELYESQPDFVFENLNDEKAFMEAIRPD